MDVNLADPSALLDFAMKEKGVSFEALKKKLTDEEYDGAADLSSLKDIKKIKTIELIARIKKMKAKVS